MNFRASHSFCIIFFVPFKYRIKCELFKILPEDIGPSVFSIHDGTLLHSKSQYTTVKHSRKLLEHTYTTDPQGLGTLTPIEFFQQDLLWPSSSTHSHSCSHKASKHTSGQSIVGLSVCLHTTTAYSPSLTCHLPAPTIGCLLSNDSLTTLSSVQHSTHS
jgi:hypothetical protein